MPRPNRNRSRNRPPKGGESIPRWVHSVLAVVQGKISAFDYWKKYRNQSKTPIADVLNPRDVKQPKRRSRIRRPEPPQEPETEPVMFQSNAADQMVLAQMDALNQQYKAIGTLCSYLETHPEAQKLDVVNPTMQAMNPIMQNVWAIIGPKPDWRVPFKVSCLNRHADLISECIRWFVGQEPSKIVSTGYVVLESVGYRNGPAGP